MKMLKQVSLYMLTRKDKQRDEISQNLQVLEDLTKFLKITLNKTL